VLSKCKRHCVSLTKKNCANKNCSFVIQWKMQHSWLTCCHPVCTQRLMTDLPRFINFIIKVKVKQSLNRPGHDLSFAGVWGSQTSRQSAHEGGTAALTLHEIFLLLISVRGWVDHRVVVRLKDEGNGKFQIKSASFCLLAQCLKQLRHRVPASCR
jgi:hypothetical protein